jgi:hypothetical protein
MISKKKARASYQSLHHSRLSVEKLEERALMAIVAVPASVPWVDTGIDVVAGESIRISTTGLLSSAQDPSDSGLNANGYVEPFQFPDPGYGLKINASESIAADGQSTCEELGLSASLEHPSTVCLGLVGKIGGGVDDATGTPLVDGDAATGDGFVGSQYDGSAPVGGRLFLGINNPLWRRTDGLVGSFKSAVQTGVTTVENLSDEWSDARNPQRNWSLNAGTQPLLSVANWSETEHSAWTTATTEEPGAPAWFKLAGGNSQWIRSMKLQGFDRGDVIVRPTSVGSGYGAANVTWTSPEDTIVTISGGLWTAASGTADVGWTLDVSGNELSSGTLLAGEFTGDKRLDLRFGSGGPGAVQNVFVQQGDILRLTITGPQSEHSDFVGVDLTITSDSRGLPSYRLGEIPDQDASRGNPISFFVDVPNGDADSLSMNVIGSPRGEISLDPASGLFSYTPTEDDKFDFSVIFQVDDGGAVNESQSQQVTIRTADVRDELELVSAPRPLPDPASSAYLSVTEEILPETRFNTRDRATRDVVISGKVVNLIPGDRNGLFERFAYADPTGLSQVNADIQELSIQAETVVIGGELRLPGTNVTIFAKELIFQDHGDHVGRLNTTPLGYATGAAQFQDGQRGEDAGDITLHIKSLRLPEGEPAAKRFVLRGGDGQAAGQGAPGTDGVSRTRLGPSDGVDSVFLFFNPVVYQVAIAPNGVTTYGSEQFPTDGSPATPGGRPGDGGSGGRFVSRLPGLAPLTDALRGVAGQAATDQRGGQPGSPQYSVHVQSLCLLTCWTSRITAERRTNHGTPWFAPRGSDGLDGSIGTLADQGTPAWLHPSTLRAMIAYAKDVYLHGQDGVATQLFSDLSNLLDEAMLASPEFASELTELRTEVSTFEHRLANHLDYFGNPPGWAPSLSFAANFRAFQNEIDSDLRTLYLTRLIQEADARQEDTLGGLGKLIDELDEGVAQAINRVNAAQQQLPDLQADLENIENRTTAIQERLIAKEQELAARAEANINQRAFFKNALGFLGGLLSVTPIPVVSGIGTGISAVGSFVSDPSVTGLVGAVKGITDPFKKETLDASAAAIDEQLALLSLPSKASREELKDYVGRLGQLGGRWGPVVGAYQELTRATQVPSGEIAAELQALKAQDPTFNALVSEVEELLAQKQVFAAELAQTIDAISENLSRINSDYAAAETLNRQRSEISQRLSHETMDRVGAMERNARDRLLRYQYNMAKSFEYETLRPYEGDFTLLHLFDEIKDILGQRDENGNPDADATFDALKSIFVYELQQTADSVWTELNDNAPQRTSEIKLRLLPEQLAVLNADGELTINLIEMGFINPARQDVKLLQMGVEQVKADLTGAPVEEISAANVQFRFEHSGASIVQSEGRRYSFEHVSSESERGFFWSTDYDAIGGELVQSEVSPSDVETLSALLGRNAGGVWSPYAHPGAWADVTIRAEATVQPVDLKVDFQELTVFVRYDSDLAATDRVLLDLRTPADISPRVLLNTADVSGRSDGEGSFTRFYSQGQQIVLTAAPVYGRYQFSAWRDNRGEILGSQPTLSLTLNQNVQVHADYEEIPELPNRLPGDADGDFDFDQLDLVQILQSAKYLTGEPATWSQGDWNADSVFDQKDIVAALQMGNYLQGPYAADSASLVKPRPDEVDDLFTSLT